MTTPHFYPIRTPRHPWGDAERAAWRARQIVQRSYAEDVVTALHALPEAFTIEHYGQLQAGTDTYPLLLAMTRDWNPALPTALVTGGVHGYETSGVHGALQFLLDHASDYAGHINLIVAPCVCPWGYERVQRWNHDAVDPNRSFRDGGLITESSALMAWIAARNDTLRVHLDLHETTDSDAHEFDPALASRDGRDWVPETIPDGFYVIGNSENPEPAFQRALIAAVEPITHIAPADAHGNLVGLPLQSPGVVWGESRSIGACAGFTDARFATTTEVYPDSPRTTPAQCNAAQVAAVRAGLDFALSSP